MFSLSCLSLSQCYCPQKKSVNMYETHSWLRYFAYSWQPVGLWNQTTLTESVLRMTTTLSFAGSCVCTLLSCVIYVTSPRECYFRVSSKIAEIIMPFLLKCIPLILMIACAHMEQKRSKLITWCVTCTHIYTHTCPNPAVSEWVSHA